MADRGFTIQESLMLHKAELAIPAFTKGKDQLDPVDVEQTRGIANVRIHVERVIGLLRRKYTILSGILPIDFLQCDPTGSQEAKIPVIDRIITVCCFDKPFQWYCTLGLKKQCTVKRVVQIL